MISAIWFVNILPYISISSFSSFSSSSNHYYYFHTMLVFHDKFNWYFFTEVQLSSRICWSILLDLNCSVVWMVMIFPWISSSLNLFARTLGINLIIITPCNFFSCNSWSPFTGVWVSASLLKSPELFWVSWPISTMLYSGWSWLFLRFPIVPLLFSSLWGPFQVYELKLVSLSPSSSTAF